MSLDFDFSKMIERLGQEEYDRITDSPFEKDKWHPVTNHLIWATMWIGMPRITEENWEEFADRLLAYQAAEGFKLLRFIGDEQNGIKAAQFIITREDVHNHIGLSTNAAPMKRTAFYKNLFETALGEGMTAIGRQSKTAHEACAERAVECGIDLSKT